MNFSYPLGLVFLIAIIVLIIIYLIKPIYQKKVVSTTFIWKKALEKVQTKNPINKIRRLVIFLIQCCIIILSTFIISNLFINGINTGKYEENIIIIDSSASMRSKVSNETRYNRAIEETRKIGKETIYKNGLITIVLSTHTPSYLLIGCDSIEELDLKLDYLISNDSCGYYDDNINSSLELVDSRLQTNPFAEVYYVTGNNYTNIVDINVIDVSKESEWNAAILDVKTDIVENYIHFYVDIASYEKNTSIDVSIKVNRVNGGNSIIRSTGFIDCNNNLVSTLEFTSLNIYEYESIEVSISADDNFSYDNYFVLYGGMKPKLSIQYSSSLSNNFFSSILYLYQNSYSNVYDITITQTTDENCVLSGYDFYIFEHIIPTILPTDGVILIVNPNNLPSSIGSVSGTVSGNYYLNSTTNHSLINFIDSTKISVSQYQKITTTSDFDVLMECNNDPIFSVKETDTSKIGILSLNLNYSNLPLLLEYPILMINYFDYFLPSLLSNKTVYDVNEIIELNPRGTQLSLENTLIQKDENNKYSINISFIGTYDITQTLLSSNKSSESIFIKVSSSSSDFSNINSNIITINRPSNISSNNQFTIVLACILFAFIVLEKYLNSKETL